VLKITNGTNHITVTRGAFESFFKSSGWVIEKKSAVQEQPNLSLEPPENEGGINVQPEIDSLKPEQNAIEGEATEEEENISGEENEPNIELLLEKPLGQLNTTELKAVAEHFGVDVKGKTKKDVRQEISEAMK
jgi:hypothetical protein